VPRESRNSVGTAQIKKHAVNSSTERSCRRPGRSASQRARRPSVRSPPKQSKATRLGRFRLAALVLVVAVGLGGAAFAATGCHKAGPQEAVAFANVLADGTLNVGASSDNIANSNISHTANSGVYCFTTSHSCRATLSWRATTRLATTTRSPRSRSTTRLPVRGSPAARTAQRSGSGPST
jgi:hypothetical protein